MAADHVAFRRASLLASHQRELRELQLTECREANIEASPETDCSCCHQRTGDAVVFRGVGAVSLAVCAGCRAFAAELR